MRRRGTEYRRPAKRRLPNWIWWLLGISLVAGASLVVLQHLHQEQLEPPALDNGSKVPEFSPEHLNFTRELLSATSVARQLADQMTLAKAYLVIAKDRGNTQLARELSSQIRNCQRLLSQAAVGERAIALEEAHPVVSQLAKLLYGAQDSHNDIGAAILKLKSHVLALEERIKEATIESAEFGQLAAESMPKSLHCLNMKLTEEWYGDPSLTRLANEQRNSPRLVDNSLYHFCIFSDNVLASSVVVNSTVSNADHPQQLVFHIVTNKVNYWAMTTWFMRSDFKGCTVEVRSIDEFSWLNASYSPLVKQLMDAKTRAYYFLGGPGGRDGETKFHNPKFISLLNHLRFYIPQIYPHLVKVVFLDDDIVVRRDLTPLFTVKLHGNVIGAVETCLESFHRFYKYFNFSNPVIGSKFDPQGCGWAFGMNVFDLITWKRVNVTARYHYWQEQNADQLLWRTGTLPAGLLTFYGMVEPLDRHWHVSGLGYDLELDNSLIESAAVVHYNGNMKPWLKLAFSRYKHIWEQYVNFMNPYVRECSMH